MKKFKIYSLLLILPLLLASCGDEPDSIVIGTGAIVDLEVLALPIHGVAVEDECEVDITIGDEQSIILHAQSQVLNVMNYVVSDGILHISIIPNTTVKSHDGISATLVMKEVDYLSLVGLGSFTLAGSPQDELDVNITGSGELNAFDMMIQDISIRISGIGDCDVHATETLDVNISGTGNIRYMGSPTITENISGIGSIEQVPQ